MQRLAILALVGLVAQLVDGTLGMAYGVTSTTLLMLFGLSPLAASATVHMAELATTAASGIAHLRFGNVDRRLVRTLVIPGALGAFAGAYFLSGVPGSAIRPFVAALLLALGVTVILRFTGAQAPRPAPREGAPPARVLVPLALVAGFIDAVGGGGWGPIATSTLMARRDSTPRLVVGSVDTSEFAVALAATAGFALAGGLEPFHWLWVAALVAGGLVAAPLAAWLVRVLPTHLLGTLVGGAIVVTNGRTVLRALDLSPDTRAWIYGFLWGSVLWAVIWGLRHYRLTRVAPPMAGPDAD